MENKADFSVSFKVIASNNESIFLTQNPDGPAKVKMRLFCVKNVHYVTVKKVHVKYCKIYLL